MARRSRRSSARRRNNKTKRKQSGGFLGFGGLGFGGLKDAFTSLFTRKAAAPAEKETQTFSVNNPMLAARPVEQAPVNNAEAAMRRKAALNNMTQSRQQSHVGNIMNSNLAKNNAAYRENNAESKREINKIIKSGNNANYNRIMREKENKIRELGGEIPEREPITKIREPTTEELESEFEEFMSRQGGGGLTKAQIEAAVNNI